MNAPVLRVRDLRTEFDTPRGVAKAVNSVSFDVHPGELVGIVGESGCGKSATAKSVLGLTKRPGRIAGGSVQLAGTELLTMSRKELRGVRGAAMSYIPQNPVGALNPILRLDRQFRDIITAHRKASRAESDALALSALESVGINDPLRVLRGYAHELSGGMAQRVTIAMATMLQPKLVVADEPTTGLDVTTERQILDLLRQQISGEGRAGLLITHDLGVVAQYCQRVLVMYAGVIVEQGSVRDVFKTPKHPYTQALLGAIPHKGQELVALKGTPPNLIDYPAGCAFFDRCSVRDEVACRQAPPLFEVGPSHLVRTFHQTESAPVVEVEFQEVSADGAR